MRCFVRTSLAWLLSAAQALAFQVGWKTIHVPCGDRDATVALYYPTQAKAHAIAMGPFTVNAAMHADPEPTVKGLILLSHGVGGTELGHSRLCEALAGHGYLVAALRHPGDNWQEDTLLKTPEQYWSVRPRQVSMVLDALLADPQWQDRITGDARGPRIGALGHSAGGYTVLALAGGEPDLARLRRHCLDECAQDPIFCSMGRPSQEPAPAAAPGAQGASLKDPRVRAVAAMAPVGVLFSAESLAAVRIPIAIWEAESDRFLVPKFHAEWVKQNLPAAELHRVPHAWHFSFMDTPAIALLTPDGDIAADPPGFDRKAFLDTLGEELAAFFDRTLQ
jgi:predicted dienelactone hydrolase